MMESCYIVFFLRDSTLLYANKCIATVLLSPNKTCRELLFHCQMLLCCIHMEIMRTKCTSFWEDLSPVKTSLRRGGNDYLRNPIVKKTEFNNICVFQAKPLITHSTLVSAWGWIIYPRSPGTHQFYPTSGTGSDRAGKMQLGSEATGNCLKCVSSKTALQTDGKTQIENAF